MRELDLQFFGGAVDECEIGYILRQLAGDRPVEQRALRVDEPEPERLFLERPQLLQPRDHRVYRAQREPAGLGEPLLVEEPLALCVEAVQGLAQNSVDFSRGGTAMI